MFNRRFVAHELRKIATALDEYNFKQMNREDYLSYLAENLNGVPIAGTSGLSTSLSSRGEGNLYVWTNIIDNSVIELREKSFSQLPVGPNYLGPQKQFPITIGFIIPKTKDHLIEFDGGVDVPVFSDGGKLYCCEPIDDGWIGASSQMGIPIVMGVDEWDIENLVDSRQPASKYVEAFNKAVTNLTRVLKDAYSFNVLESHEDEGYVITDHADNNYGV